MLSSSQSDASAGLDKSSHANMQTDEGSTFNNGKLIAILVPIRCNALNLVYPKNVPIGKRSAVLICELKVNQTTDGQAVLDLIG